MSWRETGIGVGPVVAFTKDEYHKIRFSHPLKAGDARGCDRSGTVFGRDDFVVKDGIEGRSREFFEPIHHAADEDFDYRISAPAVARSTTVLDCSTVGRFVEFPQWCRWRNGSSRAMGHQKRTDSNRPDRVEKLPLAMRLK